MMTIGQKIKMAREIRGIKQESVASFMSMSQANYSKIESSDDILLSRLVHISQALKVGVSEIINIDKNLLRLMKHDKI